MDAVLFIILTMGRRFGHDSPCIRTSSCTLCYGLAVCWSNLVVRLFTTSLICDSCVDALKNTICGEEYRWICLGKSNCKNTYIYI